MGNSLLIMSLLMIVAALALVSEVRSATEGCPAGKGICVESRYCKRDPWNNSKQHKCLLPNKKHGVCCGGCKTVRGGPGICVNPEQCESYTRDFLLDQGTLEKSQWWKRLSGVCLVTKNKLYYCCPTELHKPTPKPKPKSISKSWNDNAFPYCITPKNHPGRFVPLELCDDLYYKCKSRRSSKQQKTASECPSNASVCCPSPQNPDRLIRHSKAAKLDLSKCGNFSMTNRILEGAAADLGQFPWMANIMYYRKHKFEFHTETKKVTLCSGSLIHPKYVLTAAHCCKSGLKPISVRLGEYDLSKNKDCVDGLCAQQFIERSIEKWISHERYGRMAGKADIALVKLGFPAKIIPGQISPICLPLTEQWLMTKPSQLTVAGWGQMGNHRLSDVMMYAQLQLVNEEYCRDEDVICARGADMEGHCKGDSGGPLQQTMRWGRKARTVLFGVVSGGSAECSVADKMPGVSMLVGYYLRWILDNMNI